MIDLMHFVVKCARMEDHRH